MVAAPSLHPLKKKYQLWVYLEADVSAELGMAFNFPLLSDFCLDFFSDRR